MSLIIMTVFFLIILSSTILFKAKIANNNFKKLLFIQNEN